MVYLLIKLQMYDTVREKQMEQQTPSAACYRDHAKMEMAVHGRSMKIGKHRQA
jgi:hypothetical protein